MAFVLAVSDAQVYTMTSNLDGDSGSGSERAISRTPTPTAQTPSRTWIPVTDAPSDSSETSETPSQTTATPRVTTKTPRTTTKTPTATTKTPRATTKTPSATTDKSESASGYEGTLDSESASDSGATEESNVVDSSAEGTAASGSEGTAASGSEEASASTASSGSTTTTKKKKTIFTKSPYLEQTTPVPNGIPTADEDSESESASASPADSESASTSEESGSSSTSKTTKPKTKKKSSGSGSESSSTSKTKKSSDSGSSDSSKSKKDSSSSNSTTSSKTSDTDSNQSNSTPSPAASSTSESTSSASSSASAAAVMTDSASTEKSGLSSTVTLVLIMGGAVALVVVVAVFVYIKTSEKDDEDDEDDPVLRTARHDGSKAAAQSSTVAANYHENNNMSPRAYSEDDFYPNQHNAQYDQEPYSHPRGHNSAGSINYNDPNLDVLTPQSQIALAHSQMSLPPMAQTGQTNASSQYSAYTAQSSFYANSAYSANPSSVSQVVSKYPGMRKGKEENDVAGSDEEESDFEGDSIHDMSSATNDWKSAGRRPQRNLGDTAVSGMDQSMAESQFEPGDSRSTAASGRSSGFDSSKQFVQSEYTEYRMSTDYESSYAASKNSGYDSRYAGGKSFQSSGFSEYENAAPPRNRGDSGNSDASSYYQGKQSRFTDASFY